MKIAKKSKIPLDEIHFNFIRSGGPGGQNVNKVATAVQLRFNIFHTNALKEDVKKRLAFLAKKKITHTGDLLIKASRYRTQERNKQDALNRLYNLIREAEHPPKRRKATLPTITSIERRIQKKIKHGHTKQLRQKKFHQE